MFDQSENQLKKRKLSTFEIELENCEGYESREKKFVRYEELLIDIKDHIIFFSGYQPINQDQLTAIFNTAQAEDLEKSRSLYCPYSRISCHMKDEYYPPSCTHHRFDSYFMNEQLSNCQIFWNELRTKPVEIVYQELFNYAVQNLSIKKLQLLISQISCYQDLNTFEMRTAITAVLENYQNNFTLPEKFFFYNVHAYDNPRKFCQKLSLLGLDHNSISFHKLLLASNQTLAEYRNLAFISYHKGNYSRAADIPKFIRFHRSIITSNGQSFLAWLILEQNASIEWIKLFIGQVAWDKDAVLRAIEIKNRHDLSMLVYQFENNMQQIMMVEVA